MALLTLQWFSKVLEKQTQARILFPDSGKAPFPVLYLLHGLSDDSSSWLRNSRLEAYAADLPLIVVMPDGYRGFYTDNEAGPALGRHIGVELPAYIDGMLPTRASRSGRAIGGLSMGGYGALRTGLDHFRSFCSIHSHSGPLDWGQDARFLRRLARGNEAFLEEMKRVFGTSPQGTRHDLLHLADKARLQLPALLIDCGTDDERLPENRRFTEALRAMKIPHSYREHPGGHDWTYWDLHIREAIGFHATNLGLARSRRRAA